MFEKLCFIWSKKTERIFYFKRFILNMFSIHPNEVEKYEKNAKGKEKKSISPSKEEMILMIVILLGSRLVYSFQLRRQRSSMKILGNWFTLCYSNTSHVTANPIQRTDLLWGSTSNPQDQGSQSSTGRKQCAHAHSL